MHAVFAASRACIGKSVLGMYSRLFGLDLVGVLLLVKPQPQTIVFTEAWATTVVVWPLSCLRGLFALRQCTSHLGSGTFPLFVLAGGIHPRAASPPSC